LASLLEIMQDVADRVGLVRPSAVVGSSDHQVRQLLSLANEEGRHLARRHSWQALTFEQTFPTVAQESQTGAIPAGFDRFIPGTFYNRTTNRIVTGPLTPQEYADYKARLTSIVYEAFRVRGDAILLLPTPSAGETCAFEYITKYWCAGASDTTPDQSAWAADDDIPFIDDELFRLGVTWRFLRTRGLDYAEPYQQYELHLAQLMGRDGGARTLNMGSRADKRVPRAPQAPDGSWNIS